MRGVLISKAPPELKELPIPAPGPGEILVKNVAVSSNPKDWKAPLWFDNYEAIEGNDIAGYVERLGEGVTRFQVGDKVAAFTKMATDNKYGAYAEYSVSPAGTAFHLGPKTSFEDAAALPLTYMTAAIALFLRLGLPTPDAPCSASPPISVLIWGASSAVGIYAVQLAKKAGLYVVGIAGSGCSIATSHGADEMIDYRSLSLLEISDLIARAAGGTIHHVFDAVSTTETISAITTALVQTGGGKITCVWPEAQVQLAKLPEGLSGDVTMVGTAYDGDAEFATEWYDKLGEWLEEGRFSPQRVTVVEGGLAGVAEGLRRLQAGEVHSEKLVYRIAETPGLQ